MSNPLQLTDLNEEFGKALLRQFFEPVLIGRNPDGGGVYAPSGVTILAQQLYRDHAHLIMDEVWNKLDVEDLATRIADFIVADLTRVPNSWESRNVQKEELAKRVKEIAAQQLGQRVVDHMDLRLGAKELPTSEEVD